MQGLSSAARADRGDVVREPEPSNCQSLNAGCGSPAVFVFFFERAQLDKLRSECRKACIKQSMLKMSADGAYRSRPARGCVPKNRTRKLPSACMYAFAAKSRSPDANFTKNQHCISRLSELARDLDRKSSTKQDAVVIDLGHLTASGCTTNPKSISKISRSFLSGCG